MVALFFGIITLSHLNFLSKGFKQYLTMDEEDKDRLESRAMSKVS